MSPYLLGKLAAVPDADPGTYLGRFKKMIGESKVAPYALGGGLALGALYGIPKIIEKLMERRESLVPAVQPEAPVPTLPAVPSEPRYSANPADDSYWRSVMAASALKRNRDQQMLGGFTGEQR